MHFRFRCYRTRIHKHQSEIQALGPFTTLGAAIIAAGVAGTFGWLQYRIGRDQRHIAASQRDIAKMRIAMDLHAKRYEVLLAARDLMGEAMQPVPNKAEINELRKRLMQCRFFFPSHIDAIAKKIDNACAQLSVLMHVVNPRQDILDKTEELHMQVVRHLDQWPAPFSEVMTFRDVE